MTELALAQARTNATVDRLAVEMLVFKDEMGRQMGNLTNKLGRLVEDIIGPSVPETFTQLFQITQVDFTGIRMGRSLRSDPGQFLELDALAAGGDVLLAVEVRSAMKPDDLPDAVLKFGQVRAFFPGWAEDRRVAGAVASFHVDPSLVTRAERLGLYVFGLDRDLIEVRNRAGFQPRWF